MNPGEDVDRTVAEEALKRSEAKYRDLFDSAPHAYFSVGIDGIIKRANAEACEMLGYTGKDLVGMSILTLYPDTPDGLNKAKKVFKEFKAGEQVRNEELQMLNSDGLPIWISLSVSPVTDADGNVIESRSAFLNITDRKRVEHELALANERWERSFRAVGEGMFIIDKDQTVVQANRAFSEMLGYGPEELIGKKCYELLHGTGEPPKFCVTCAAVNRGQSAHAEIFESHLSRHFEVAADPVLDREGEIEYVVHIIRDITDRKRSEEELQRVNTELEGYAHTVSHDLRGPLSSVSMAVALLNDSLTRYEGEELRESVKEYADILSVNTDKAFSLIEDLLVLAEAGQSPQEVTAVEVNAVVERILEERSTEILEKGIELSVGDDLRRVVVNPTHLYQLFSNLIGNAVIHNDSDNPRVEVSLLAGDDDYRTYLVRDNGSGVPPDDLEKIFLPFFKGKTGETGIGLSTVKKIVELYGGHIEAYNDNGACFRFALKDFDPAQH